MCQNGQLDRNRPPNGHNRDFEPRSQGNQITYTHNFDVNGKNSITSCYQKRFHKQILPTRLKNLEKWKFHNYYYWKRVMLQKGPKLGFPIIFMLEPFLVKLHGNTSQMSKRLASSYFFWFRSSAGWQFMQITMCYLTTLGEKSCTGCC